MKPITLRPSIRTDRQCLLELINSVAGERKYLPNVSYSSTPEWNVALAGKAEQYLLLVAQAGDELVGWCRLFPQNTDETELGIGLLATYRRKGIGSAMLKVCVEWARKSGFRQIVLDTMAGNVAAQAFFRKHGFVETDREVRRVGDGEPYDAVLMQLDL